MIRLLLLLGFHLQQLLPPFSSFALACQDVLDVLGTVVCDVW